MKYSASSLNLIDWNYSAELSASALGGICSLMRSAISASSIQLQLFAKPGHS